MPTLIALTGGMGCGKSTVAALCKEFPGVRVIDCDAVAKSLAFSDECRAKMRGALGVAEEDDLNPAQVAHIIFSDSKKREAVEGIITPLVWKHIQMQSKGLTARDLIIVESALIFELGWEEKFEAIVVVVCPPHVQRERLKKRGMTGADIDARLAAQLPQVEKVKRADFVVTTLCDDLATDCGTEELRRRVRVLLELIRRKT